MQTTTTVTDIFSALRGATLRGFGGDGYRPQTVPSLSGTNGEGGFEPNPFRLRSGSASAVITDVSVGTDTASAYFRTRAGADLVDNDGNVVVEVAGIPLRGLAKFRSYSIISGGELNFPSISVKLTESGFDQLVNMGVIPAGEFDPNGVYEIQLRDYPIVRTTEDAVSVSADTVRSLLRLTALKSFLAACTRETGSGVYTPDQIEALRNHCLTPSLVYSGKTTVPYRDRAAALASGEIVEVPEYVVSVGLTDITSTDKLHSANKFIDRFYTGIDGLTIQALIGDKSVIQRKVLGSRVKVTAVDTFMAEIFDSLLGITNTDIPELPANTLTTIRDRVFDSDDLADGKAAVTAALDEIWNTLRPIVFHFGTTFAVPNFDGEVVTMNAEEFASTYPNANLSKAEKDGDFVVVNGETVFTVTKSTRTIPGPNFNVNSNADSE
jgi:hypothetical protein